ncbi:DUF2851 family protein [Changchengzhania lutea]|uniref:DUF2851 family protein n=1 Tax=Changchengzhania lutea TaxID=2049305 RepID=UPI002938ED7F|nr:DUF2851 family protein [Changchengzhania lutea]
MHDLKTTDNGEVAVVHSGQHNLNSGPDFFNAQVKIDDQLWAGNVEIHIKSSDWFLHNHEQDPTYDNVILHVVWEHDTDVFRSNNTTIPTVVLKDYIDESLFQNYLKLFSKKDKWINCENDFNTIDDFTLNHWLERLYFERLERKANAISELLKASKNNWETVLFKMLTKNFGLKVNGEAFLSLAESVDFSVIRKTQNDRISLEALFMGQAGLLERDIDIGYHQELDKAYGFLKQKFQLDNSYVVPLQFFRLRPSNFPTIRLSQLASLYHEHQNLFSKIIAINSVEDFYKLFHVSTAPFWKTHYTFEKESKATEKIITKAFVDLLIMNTILPIKFCYAHQKGARVHDELLNMAHAIASEKNTIVDAFNRLQKISNSALISQALIQLKSEYCDKNKCLQCAVGNALIHK